VSVAAAAKGCLNLCSGLLLAGLGSGAVTAAPLQGSVGLASELVQRGLSLSDGRPALWLELAQPLDDRGVGLSAGVVAPAYPSLGGTARLRLGLGYLHQLRDDLAVDLQLTRYQTLGGQRARRYAYTEIAAQLAWGLGPHQLTLGAALSDGEGLLIPPQPFRRGGSHRLEAGWNLGLGRGLTFELALGRQQLRLEPARSYTYGSGGLAWQQRQTRWSLVWLDSSAEQRLAQPVSRAAGRWVGAVTRGF
jgi:hypothetical protein